MITAYKQRCLVAVRNGYAQSGVNAMREAIVGALAAALLLVAGVYSQLWQANITGDWRLMVDGYGSSTGSYYLSVINQPIPEPSTMLLFVAALPAIAVRLRRRRTYHG